MDTSAAPRADGASESSDSKKTAAAPTEDDKVKSDDKKSGMFGNSEHDITSQGSHSHGKAWKIILSCKSHGKWAKKVMEIKNILKKFWNLSTSDHESSTRSSDNSI